MAAKPTATANTKNSTIFSSTTGRLTLSPARLVTTVRAIRPSTSSISAAAKMVPPTLVSSFPSSFRVSTVMLTEVAVRMVPRNTSSSRVFPGSQPVFPASHPNAVPMASGTSTPHRATRKPGFPAARSSFKSVPIPAVNRMTMTPNSLSWDRNSVSVRMSSMAGPRMRPASSAPTTWGIWNRRVTIPSTLVLSKISARSSR